MDFREFLRQGFVVLDGATGSNLQQAGMESGDCPEQWISFIRRHLLVIELN